LNGFVGAMVGGFELAGRLVMDVRAVVKAAIGERAAEPFVKEQEEQGDLNPFRGETVGVAGSVTLQQAVGFELAQVGNPRTARSGSKKHQAWTGQADRGGQEFSSRR
jgi:hypothetical protein